MSAYEQYLNMKTASVIGALGNGANALAQPLMAGGLTHMIGSGLRGIGNFIKKPGIGKLIQGGEAKPGSVRHAIGHAFDRTGLAAENVGGKLQDMTQGALNVGPGIKYDADKLPGLFGFEGRIGGPDKATKLTLQRGAYWAGNAAAAGTAIGELKNAVTGSPVKQAHADAAALIAYYEGLDQ